MRYLLSFLIVATLTVPALAQNLDLAGSRGAVKIENGNVQLFNDRGSRVELPMPADGSTPTLRIDSSSRARHDVVVGRGPSGEWVIQDSGTGESAVVDMAPNGVTRIESARGSYTVPTSLLREFIGDDPDAVRFFEAMSR